jgi:hypothetical protein
MDGGVGKKKGRNLADLDLIIFDVIPKYTVFLTNVKSDPCDKGPD